jgi:hypothetical protein
MELMKLMSLVGYVGCGETIFLPTIANRKDGHEEGV